MSHRGICRGFVEICRGHTWNVRGVGLSSRFSGLGFDLRFWF